MKEIRGCKIEPGADLRGADLRGADLQGANLQEADLQGADLCDANFDQAIISYRNNSVKIRFEFI